MGILKFLFDSSSSSNNEKLYKVRFQGTIRANGPIPINKVVEMDEKQMHLFMGSKRKEAVKGWINANYPGAKNVSVVAKNEGRI